MAQNFITNSPEKTLEERLKTLIEYSKELKFLVGFFYFSAIRPLYEKLKELYEKGKLGEEHIKILVGLSVDKGVYGLYELAHGNKSKEEVKNRFLQSLEKAFTSEELDKKEIYEQVEFFLKLLKEEKLVIRKTREPNHAKIYLFKLEGNLLPHTFITGSSNLTLAGLKGQEEFNVEIKDYGFESAEKYFDERWERAVPLSKDDIIQVFKTRTFFKEITPFVAYAYLLKNYLELHQGKIPIRDLQELMEKKGYKPYDYQLSAVAQAVATCEDHGGVILADVVGLGKTVIASLTAKALGKRGIVICPPHLVGDEAKTSGWKKYLEDFGLYDWEVFSLGKLEDAKMYIKNRNIEVVIVDEAHRFRNQRTKRYHQLLEICRGKTVILLTATPFNNRPADIFALLKLFTIPKKSTLTLDGNLAQKFEKYDREFRKLAYIRNYHNSPDSKKREKAKKYYKELFGEREIDIEKVSKRAKELSRKIKAVIEKVVIRRNRLDLKDYKDKIEMPKVRDPQEWFFELDKKQLEFYDEAIKAFYEPKEGGRFHGAIYIPIKYEKGYEKGDVPEEDELPKDIEDIFIYYSQKNLYDFMRRLLVKRFESSFKAFYESLNNFIDIHQKALDFAKKTGKFILDRKLMEDLVYATDEEIEKELKKYQQDLERGEINKKYYKIYEIDKFKQKKEFFQDIQKDIELFEELRQKVEELRLLEEDPKAKRLIKGIKEFLKENKKVVIFTEYVDTAEYLKGVLEKEFGEKVLSAIGNISKGTYEKILKNFDAQYVEQEDDHYILITTDKLSEGINLNRACVVINYDIPWNPVRVIQRVGRINRIGKKVCDEIFIVNFFPTEKGANIVKSREIAQMKMFMIHHVLGEDAKIFSPDEEPKPSELYRNLNTYPEEKEESFFSKVKKKYEEILEKHPWVKQELEEMPRRIKVAKKGEKNELMVFIRRGKDLFVGYKDYSQSMPVEVSFEEVYEKIKASPDDESKELSPEFWEHYNQILRELFTTLSPISDNSLESKARNMVETLLKMEELKEEREFLNALMEDMVEYQTLSEYALSKIVGWERLVKKIVKLKTEKPKSKKPKDIGKLIEELKGKVRKLKEELGEDFLQKTKARVREESKEVIIAVENQNENGGNFN
ncbi:MAG: helicase-related protein [Candidatus Caldipriscus sp.]|nr:helicase-related protein [Candidatus Caldipriscus sp.]